MDKCNICDSTKENPINVKLIINNIEYELPEQNRIRTCGDCLTKELLTVPKGLLKINNISTNGQLERKLRVFHLLKQKSLELGVKTEDLLLEHEARKYYKKNKIGKHKINWKMFAGVGLLNLIKIYPFKEEPNQYFKYINKIEIDKLIDMGKVGSFYSSRCFNSPIQLNNKNVWIKDRWALIYKPHDSILKTCAKCLHEKHKEDYTYFHWSRNTSYCKECVNKTGRTSYENLTLEEKEEIYLNVKQWQKANKDKVNDSRRRYFKNNPSARAGRNLSKRVRDLIKFPYDFSASIGCTGKELKEHLEKLFVDGMSWDNYGPGYKLLKNGKPEYDMNGNTIPLKQWHVDHILPLSSFDLTNIEEVRKANNYTNLQPLWSTDNISKSNKIIKNEPTRAEKTVINGMNVVKECTSCQNILPVEMFARQKSTKDGLKYTCKKCSAARARARYETHKDDHVRKVVKWQIENNDKVKKYKADWARKSNCPKLPDSV